MKKTWSGWQKNIYCYFQNSSITFVRSKTTIGLRKLSHSSEMRNDASMHPEGLKVSQHLGFLESKCQESISTLSSPSTNTVEFNPLTAKLSIWFFTHLKLCLADAIHNFKWVKIIQIWHNGCQLISNIADWCHILSLTCLKGGTYFANKKWKPEYMRHRRLKGYSGLLADQITVIRNEMIV